MVSLRLITTGLDDVHSVIGYVLAKPSKLGEVEGLSIIEALIQPRKDSAFSYEAMHDINGISIPHLREFGVNREASCNYLAELLDWEDVVLVWYKPFISKFMEQIKEEFNLTPYVADMVDLYTLAKQKGLDSPSFKLADVYEYTECDNLFELYEYLKELPEPTRLRRV